MTQNVKALDKITSKSKHIGQKVARSKCRNVIICVLYPEASLSSIQFYLLSSKDSCSLMSNVSIAEYAMLYSLYVGGEVRELSLVPLFYASLGYVEPSSILCHARLQGEMLPQNNISCNN